MSMFPCGNGTSATRSRLDQMIDRSGLIGERTRPACWFRRLAETNFSPFFSHKGRKGHREPSSCLPLCPLCPKIVVAIRDLIRCQCITPGKSLLQGRCLQQNGRRPISLRRVLGGRRLLKRDSASSVERKQQRPDESLVGIFHWKTTVPAA